MNLIYTTSEITIYLPILNHKTIEFNVFEFPICLKTVLKRPFENNRILPIDYELVFLN